MVEQGTGWNSRLAWSGYVLGIALGGFFDGILLHQVLQWHHLLSLVPGQSLRSVEAQILADGLFHVLMYAIALVGLWLLWGARTAFAKDGAARRLLAATVFGFAIWNVIDVVGFHWIAHIHRIRVDVPPEQRLGWDLGWLALFGAVPLAIAALIARRHGASGGGRTRPVMLSLLVAAVAVLSLRAPAGGGSGRAVLFRGDMAPAEVFAAVAAVDGRVVWAATDGRLIGVDLSDRSSSWRLYRHGALLVGGPGSPAGCLNWLKTERSGRVRQAAKA
jgi:uncharacterized membrane protein